MLPRTERLGKTAFETAFARSRTFHHPLLQMRVHRRADVEAGENAPAREDDLHRDSGVKSRKTSEGALKKHLRAPVAFSGRAAFVVAKKLGRATVRNRVRRRMREAYRLSAWRGNATLRGLDLIFLAKPPALEARHSDLCAAMDELLERAAREASRRNGRRDAGGDASTRIVKTPEN